MKDITAERLTREAHAAQSLIAGLQSDDTDLNHDMVEGETSFLEAIEAALAEIDDCEITVEGCKAKEAQIAGRRTRAEKRIERLRGLIEQAILVADLPSVKTATATLTVKTLPPKYMVEDESKIPAEFWKRPDPILDRKALGAAFKEGRDIPGLGRTNGTASLQIRRA